MREFLRNRVKLVRDLRAANFPGVDDADLSLILLATLSGCAALRDPGRGKDRKRFLELLTNYGCETHRANWVSIPALINKGLIQEADTLYQGGNETRIFTGDEIDLPLETAKAKYPHISVEKIESATYAVLIYEYLRCGYSHEYIPDKTITKNPPSRKSAQVSYIGRGIVKSSSRGNVESTVRMICFHLDYLIELAQYHVERVGDEAT